MKKLNNSISESGKAGTYILILTIFILIIVGFKIGKAHFDNATLKSEVEEMCERELLEPGYDLEKNLIHKAYSYGIKLKPKDIKYTFNMNRDQIKLWFTYNRILDLYLFHPSISLSINVTKEMAKAKGILDKFKEDYESGSRGASQRYLDSVKEKLNR